MADVESSRLIQAESDGQQKLSGSFVLPQWLYDVGHESERLGIRLNESNAKPCPMLTQRVKSSKIEARLLLAVDHAILLNRQILGEQYLSLSTIREGLVRDYVEDREIEMWQYLRLNVGQESERSTLTLKRDSNEEEQKTQQTKALKLN
jgi:hypothetical protein